MRMNLIFNLSTGNVWELRSGSSGEPKGRTPMPLEGDMATDCGERIDRSLRRCSWQVHACAGEASANASRGEEERGLCVEESFQ